MFLPVNERFDHTVRQRQRQKNGMHWIQCECSYCVAMAAAVAAVIQGAESKWVPTPFYVAAYAVAAVAKPLAALLPHRVNESENGIRSF